MYDAQINLVLFESERIDRGLKRIALEMTRTLFVLILKTITVISNIGYSCLYVKVLHILVTISLCCTTIVLVHLVILKKYNKTSRLVPLKASQPIGIMITQLK